MRTLPSPLFRKSVMSLFFERGDAQQPATLKKPSPPVGCCAGSPLPRPTMPKRPRVAERVQLGSVLESSSIELSAAFLSARPHVKLWRRRGHQNFASTAPQLLSYCYLRALSAYLNVMTLRITFCTPRHVERGYSLHHSQIDLREEEGKGG